MGVHFHYRSIVQPETYHFLLKAGLVENNFGKSVVSRYCMHHAAADHVRGKQREPHFNFNDPIFDIDYTTFISSAHTSALTSAQYSQWKLSSTLTWSSVGISSTAAAVRLILEKEKQKVVGEGERGAEQLKKTKTKINWCLTWLTVNSLLFSETLMCAAALLVHFAVCICAPTLSRLIGDRWCWHKESFVRASPASFIHTTEFFFGEVNLITWRVQCSRQNIFIVSNLKRFITPEDLETFKRSWKKSHVYIFLFVVI